MPLPVKTLSATSQIIYEIGQQQPDRSRLRTTLTKIRQALAPAAKQAVSPFSTPSLTTNSNGLGYHQASSQSTGHRLAHTALRAPAPITRRYLSTLRGEARRYTARLHSGGEGDRRAQLAVSIAAPICLNRDVGPADLPGAPPPGPQPGPAQGLHRDPPTARRAACGRVGQPEHPRQRRHDRANRRPGLADRLPTLAVRARAQPRSNWSAHT